MLMERVTEGSVQLGMMDRKRGHTSVEWTDIQSCTSDSMHHKSFWFPVPPPVESGRKPPPENDKGQQVTAVHAHSSPAMSALLIMSVWWVPPA